MSIVYSTPDSTRDRRGFTLPEMLVVITVTSVVGALAARLLIEMQRARQGQERAVTADAAQDRLARTFRGDAHRASAAASAEPAQLRLTLPNGDSIVYSAVDGRVERSLEEEERVVRRDVFPVGGTSRFALSDDGRFATWSRGRAAPEAAAARDAFVPRPFEFVVESAIDRRRIEAGNQSEAAARPRETEKTP